MSRSAETLPSCRSPAPSGILEGVAIGAEKRRGLRVYGKEEEESLCREFEPEFAVRVERSNGHHFDGDYKWIARRIVEELTAPRAKHARTSSTE